jgi:hypothetical protein
MDSNIWVYKSDVCKYNWSNFSNNKIHTLHATINGIIAIII